MPTSNVSIRLSLQDAETVRAGLEKLGVDGAAALKKLEAASAHPSQGLTAVDKTVANLKSRVEETAQSIGPLGILLGGLGPIGLTVAAGIGAAVAIVYEMSKAAGELTDRAASIRNFADETGLTTTAIQALTAEGAKFGLGGEQIAKGLQLFSTNLEKARHGTGDLYNELFKISPELAHQISAAKDVADAYDIVGKAIERARQAGDTGQANTLARTFGRNPGAQGVLAADVSSQGGINALAAGYQNAGKALDAGLIKHLSTLKTEIEEINQRTKDLWASMFAEDVLERQKRAAELMERMAQSAKEIGEASKGESWGDFFLRKFNEIGGGFEGADTRTVDDQRQDLLQKAARRKLEEGMAAGKSGSSDLAAFGNPFGRTGEAGAPVEKVTKAAKDAAIPIEVVLEDTKKWMAVLGSAATPAEQLRLKTLELAVAVKDHSASSQVAARAQQEFTNAQTAGAIAARERIGVASQEEIATVGLIQLQKDRRDGFIKSDQEMEQAEARVAKAAEQTYKQIQVQNAAFKGLKQFELDSLDVNANLDKLATGTLGNLNTALVDMEMNTRRNSDTWRQFGLTAVRAIEEVINKAALAKAISLLGVGGGAGGAGGLGALAASMFGFAGGGVMGPGGPLSLRRYAGGGVANSPQLAMFGEGSRPEAYVPLPDGRAIPVNLNGGGGGGQAIQNVTHVHVTVPPGSSQADANQMASSFARQAHGMMTRIIDERIVKHLRVGGMLNQA